MRTMAGLTYSYAWQPLATTGPFVVHFQFSQDSRKNRRLKGALWAVLSKMWTSLLESRLLTDLLERACDYVFVRDTRI